MTTDMPPSEKGATAPILPCMLTSWIELEMVDEHQQPLPDEPFVVRLEDGTLRKGKLDCNGFARVSNLPEGEVEVSFPRLDAGAWKRL